MKNKLLWISSALLSNMIFFMSCDNEDTEPQASIVAKAELLAPASGGTYVLSNSNANNEVFVAEISSANFGFSAATSYIIEVCKDSDNFSQVGLINLGNFNSPSANLSISVKQVQLNQAVLGAGGVPSFSGNFKMRVVAKTSVGSLQTVGDNIVTFTATPYDAFSDFPRIHVPGNYQAASGYGPGNWSPADAPRIFSANSNDKYEGFVHMNDPNPEFKFTPGPSWSGDKGDVNIAGNSGVLTSPGNNIKVPGYTGNTNATYLYVDWNANTYIAENKQIAIIGTAVGGWAESNALYLTYDNNPLSPHFRKFTRNVTLTAGGSFLIRIQDFWAGPRHKLGGPGTSDYTIPNITQPTTLVLQGQNFVTNQGGNFKIVVDLRNSANYNMVFIPNP